ncbi:MAG: 2-amino-4-hydroxy-6-hydroxymethyldihydropteridine diphosphokinase [Jaaginema sp. PMC 1079.18]|nr:2-amino-4-hydroxy-6-hydroxymethyldihydropteridine diphosphokinase [Jaaginema sp. PMC 1080.18]MEC4853713.1 2-amino-4-hydroxy-6-hydroxymethyldihydropteridine diphosphokinase [Jaaginema sp. PMC 1079.18]MEC4865766.1 2-amino-4-hydroxy-6-hydroxymethyldihydropteridine diphosphokinase [Jaaginema sp. PMC 1078.18]
MKSQQCAIALGSNLGDSLTILEQAIQKLNHLPGITLQKRSSWYETVPIGPPQPNYLNGCAIASVAGDRTPVELLEKLLAVEAELGRLRGPRWGPRTLDLDLVLWEDLILEMPQLQIPHPRFRDRAFVLVPLAEIAPHWRDPVTGQTIRQLQQNVDCTGVNPDAIA